MYDQMATTSAHEDLCFHLKLSHFLCLSHFTVSVGDNSWWVSSIFWKMWDVLVLKWITNLGIVHKLILVKVIGHATGYRAMMYHLMHGEWTNLFAYLLSSPEPTHLGFVSLHSIGDRICRLYYTGTGQYRVTAGPVTAVPTSAPALCEKCVGDYACYKGIDQSKIGCGSCIGYGACAHNLEPDVTIGANSCVGMGACLYASGELRVAYCMVGGQPHLLMKICFFHLKLPHLLCISHFTVSVGDNSWWVSALLRKI